MHRRQRQRQQIGDEDRKIVETGDRRQETRYNRSTGETGVSIRTDTRQDTKKYEWR